MSVQRLGARTKGNAYDIWSMYDLAKRDGDNGTITPQTLLRVNWTIMFGARRAENLHSNPRNRWFYFALANCQPGTKDIVVDKNKGATPSPSADEKSTWIRNGNCLVQGRRVLPGPLDVEFRITMKNNEGIPMEDHFSADEFGI